MSGLIRGLEVIRFGKVEKNGFIFQLRPCKDVENPYYATVIHVKKDIGFNSQWQDITFHTLQEGFDWCDAFKPENFNCLGEDTKTK